MLLKKETENYYNNLVYVQIHINYSINYFMCVNFIKQRSFISILKLNVEEAVEELLVCAIIASSSIVKFLKKKTKILG